MDQRLLPTKLPLSPRFLSFAIGFGKERKSSPLLSS